MKNTMDCTLHILTNPFGITHTKYRMEPFNMAALKFIENMRAKGWHIIHYGHESAEVPVENVICITNSEFPPPANDGDLMLHKPELEGLYNTRAAEGIAKRKRRNDMILCFYGHANKQAADAHSDLKILEPSIGYMPESVFAQYRAFVSYSQMHYYYGLHKSILAPSWYDAVIPNAFTPSEFEFSAAKEDYYVFLGRVNWDKGVTLCVQITEKLGKKLIIAGPQTNLDHLGFNKIPDHVEMIGFVNPEQRSNILKHAKALICPTHYIEPFGNIAAEAQFCGTPVICTDWGGYVDSVVNGVTGFRCRDFQSFMWAAKNVSKLDPHKCRSWAIENFSDQVVHNKFNNWISRINMGNFYHYNEVINYSDWS